MFLISLSVFGVASLICGLTHSAPLLIAARFAQGLGGGSMLICVIAILSHQFGALASFAGGWTMLPGSLVAGIVDHLQHALPDTVALSAVDLRTLAERVAGGGNLESLGQRFPALIQADPSGTLLHEALVQGFSWLMLYGGASVWILGAVSFIFFSPGKDRSRYASR